jgi:signal transduction histidine kinase/CheY-like chemotaxis protein
MMRKQTFAIVVLFSFFVPYFAVAAEAPMYVYIPEYSSFATERIIYNAVTSAGETPQIERVFDGIRSVDQFAGRRSIIVAGTYEAQSFQGEEPFTIIDIPIGTVDYTAYVREGSDLYFDSWDDLEGLTLATALSRERCFARVSDGRSDVYVYSVYDGIKPVLPEGVVEAGIIQSENTYCMYQSSRTDSGDILRKGFQNIQENGVFDRIKANSSVEADNEKVIFFLGSYSNDMLWQAQAEETFRQLIIPREDGISFYIRNLNFRRANYPAVQFDMMETYIRATFMNEFPDVILVMDNDALRFIKEYYHQLFYGVPVVFCGINSYNESLTSGFTDFSTGISEFIDPRGTIEFALANNPNINRIHALFDDTSSTVALKASIMGAIQDGYGSKMDSITTNENQTFSEIIAELKSFDEDTLVILGPYFSDEKNRFMGEAEVARRLSEAVDIPIYTVLSGFLDHGVVGGNVSYSSAFITEAVGMALRILDGANVSDIPIIQREESVARFNTFIVDKNVADRFNIRGSLYKDATVLNDLQSMFEAYPTQFAIGIALIVIVIVSSILFTMLARSDHKQKLALHRAETEKEANRVKSDFLARMSHEIRTPLNAIIGIDEIILRDEISDKVRENALVIKRSGKNLLSIINDILDFSKIESGKMELIPVEYNAASLLHDTISMIRMKVAEKTIDVKMDVAVDFPSYLYGDEIRVRQVLLNILNNSAKYTKEGSITLTAAFDFDSDEKTGGTAVFTITDTGIGIKEEDISKLFVAFSQVDTHSNRKVEGTGLGLAITQTLIALMNGNVSVKSEYGKGSVFTLRIPQKIINYVPLKNLSEEFYRREEEEKDENELFEAPDVSILAVDDVDANLMVICGLLEPYKVKVDTASSGIDAINALIKKDYDFIFMDHMMPEMDGIETTKRIRNQANERSRQIPIIALTANAISGMKEMFIANGFNDFISKPIDIHELERIMRTWIPAEKKQFHTGDYKEKNELLGRLASIKGIDIAQGLRLFGGRVETYENILRHFAEDLSKQLDLMLRKFAENDFGNVQLSIHSIKGMTGNLFCLELFDLSKKLETALQENNYGFVRSNLPSFVEKVQIVIESVQNVLT